MMKLIIVLMSVVGALFCSDSVVFAQRTPPTITLNTKDAEKLIDRPEEATSGNFEAASFGSEFTTDQRTQQPRIINVDGHGRQFLVGLDDTSIATLNNSVLVLDYGTVLGVENEVLVHHHGRFMLCADKQPIQIATANATISVPADAVIMIETRHSELEALDVLSCPREAVIARNEERTLSVTRGESILRSGNGLSAGCTKVCEMPSVFQKCLVDQRGAATQRTSNIRKAVQRSVTARCATIWAAQGSQFFIADRRCISMPVGWIFLRAGADTTVKMRSISMRTKRGADLNLECLPSFERVGVCGGLKSLDLEVMGNHTDLCQGQEVMVVSHVPTKRELSAIDGVVRRSPQCIKLDQTHYCVLSYFSIFSLLSNAEHLAQIRNACSASNCAVRDDLLKSAVVCDIAMNSRGQYMRRLDVLIPGT